MVTLSITILISNSKDQVISAITFKMIRALAVFCIVIGLVAADPVARISSSLEDLETSGYDNIDHSLQKEARLVPDITVLVLDILQALIGYKVTALGLAVSVIKFLVSNIVVIVVGAAVAVGFCKLTGKCSLKYDELIPVSHFRSIVTPEYIETAENFLVRAVKRYAEDEEIISPLSTDY